MSHALGTFATEDIVCLEETGGVFVVLYIESIASAYIGFRRTLLGYIKRGQACF